MLKTKTTKSHRLSHISITTITDRCKQKCAIVLVVLEFIAGKETG